jgi:hypothetical protein
MTWNPDTYLVPDRRLGLVARGFGLRIGYKIRSEVFFG